MNWPAYISNVFIAPFLFVVMLTLTGRFAGNPGAAEAYVIGMSIYAIPVILLGGIIQSFYHERIFGTISFLYASRGNRLAFYGSRGCLHYPNGILVVSSALIFSWLFLGLDFSRADWLLLACSVLLITASCTAFALFAGNFAMFFRERFTLLAVTTGIFVTMTGAIIPVSSLPAPFEQVSQILPLTHGLAAFREGFSGANVASTYGDLLRELLVGLGYGIAGSVLFRLLEVAAKRQGTYATAE